MKMRCAGEEHDFPEREFAESDGEFTCKTCGWMQSSFGAGLVELLHSATWHDAEAFIEIRNLAIENGAIDPIKVPIYTEV